MKIINIEETSKTPIIILDDEEQKFEIKGNCRPENIRDFYSPVIDKLEDYFNNLTDTQIESFKTKAFKANFKLGYFNSASAKFIADIILSLSSFIKKGYQINIYWHYEEDHDDMLEAGEEFSDMTDLPFKYIMIANNE